MTALFLLWFPPMAVVAQASDLGGGNFDVAQALAQIGIGALIAVPVFWWAMNERKERIATQVDNRALHEAAIKRERELGERTSIALHDAATTLEAVKKSMDATIASVQHQPQLNDLDVALRRVEHLFDEMREERKHR